MGDPLEPTPNRSGPSCGSPFFTADVGEITGSSMLEVVDVTNSLVSVGTFATLVGYDI